MKNTTCKVSFSLVGAFLTLSAFALPSSARLFQQKYQYKVSCLLCHTDGGGSAPNRYGKAYLRAGANSTSFKKIETADSDDDGIKNLAEILAKSNPGNKQSVPTAAGDWLANAGAIPIPKKQLEKLFPDYSKFSAIEGTLNEKQIEFLKSKLGRDIIDDDKLPTFYFAEKDGKKQAVAQLVSENISGKTVTSGIAVATSGSVIGIEYFGGTALKDMEANAGLKAKYLQKSATSLPSKPSTTEEQLLHSSVERSLYLMQAVFGGAK